MNSRKADSIAAMTRTPTCTSIVGEKSASVCDDGANATLSICTRQPRIAASQPATSNKPIAALRLRLQTCAFEMPLRTMVATRASGPELGEAEAVFVAVLEAVRVGRGARVMEREGVGHRDRVAVAFVPLVAVFVGVSRITSLGRATQRYLRKAADVRTAFKIQHLNAPATHQ
jgi:hypothetical protein